MPGLGQGLVLDEKVPRRLRSAGQSKDVFALVKTFMHDEELQQPPLCVLPESLLPSTQSFVNSLNTTSLSRIANVDEQRAEQLLEIAEALDEDFPHLHRGAAYLRSLTDKDRPRQPYTRLKFVDAGPRGFNLGGWHLKDPPLPPKPHKLQVVFHHSKGDAS